MVDLFNVEVFLALLVTGFAGLLFVTSLLSAKRYGNVKLALSSGAFLVFAVKGGLLLYWLVVPVRRQSIPVLLLDLAILVLMYLSVAKR